ncbi:tubulin-like doman-containing protein [Streptomyces sp. NBRC 109706]|uniref:tubulin-like doman-containing protein n=1 Tax=Streptomyces sp. NBRC 109706 TaxID=1550035 RepID=UPI0008334991|nr:tubulin-like doman-containing protein [Streptomyces sp. NBRC 109706]
MRIYQPVLFVGLGGTGNRIGAELERTLRRELCGPDGTLLTNGGQRAPFQLPDCIQFVYADYSEAELNQLPHLSTRGSEAAPYTHTSRAIHDLLPAGMSSSPEVTRTLRVSVHDEVSEWLPPTVGEPRVAPLHAGAGQLPTVGRSALFATLREGLEPVLRPLRDAIGAIGHSGGDLRELGGGHIKGCDVFVAFSVSGGTGAGIFYDFLHLIGREFQRSFKQSMDGVKIYPLVVMPSAFPPEAGGGRAAELNASRALVDISRLVDSQNAPDAPDQFGDVLQPQGPGIRYPGGEVVTLRPSTMQTAILFGRPVGLQPEDLRRSISAIVMSLIGTELGDDQATGRAEGNFQSFAASFVNQAVERATPSRSGIGHRGMSTSLAASLTVPVDDLAEIVAGRLLAAGVRGMAEEARRHSADGRGRVTEMFRSAGIGPLWEREPRPIADPDPLPRGGRAIGQALRDRQDDMDDALRRLESDLNRDMPRLVEEFRPAAATRGLLAQLGPFHLDKVLTGVPDHQDRVAAVGLVGMLDNRRNQPERPEHVQFTPPSVPPIRRSLGGITPARWGDADVQACVADQNAWYRYRANQLWHAAWKEYESRWRPQLARAVRETGELVRALQSHEEEESRLFADRRKELYRDDRKGVSYLLPPQDSLRSFYDDVFERLMQQYGLPEGSEAAGLLERMIEPSVWQRALDLVRRSPDEAVREVKQVIEGRVKRLFTERSVLDERPLLPSLGDLLLAAAGEAEMGSAIDGKWLTQFRSQLAGLLSVGFVPDGNGPLKILIVHPSTQALSRAERYLAQALSLPREPAQTIEFRAVPTDSITVVLFRSGMSLTDISEVGKVLRLWSDARDLASPEDALDWRQRLGYEDDWLASTEEDRKRILHRLLCMVWNGQVQWAGDPASPRALRFLLQDGGTATMTLELDEAEDGVSSWVNLLRAYERFALLDEGSIVDDVCGRLMQAQPKGLTKSPAAPSRLFRLLVHEVAPQQLKLIRELGQERDGEDEAWLAPSRHFWMETFDGALHLPFPGVKKPTRRSLWELLRAADRKRRNLGDAHGRAQPKWHDEAPATAQPATVTDEGPNGYGNRAFTPHEDRRGAGHDSRPDDGFRGRPRPGHRPRARHWEDETQAPPPATDPRSAFAHAEHDERFERFDRDDRFAEDPAPPPAAGRNTRYTDDDEDAFTDEHRDRFTDERDEAPAGPRGTGFAGFTDEFTDELADGADGDAGAAGEDPLDGGAGGAREGAW